MVLVIDWQGSQRDNVENSEGPKLKILGQTKCKHIHNISSGWNLKIEKVGGDRIEFVSGAQKHFRLARCGLNERKRNGVQENGKTTDVVEINENEKTVPQSKLVTMPWCHQPHPLTQSTPNDDGWRSGREAILGRLQNSSSRQFIFAIF